jgi:peptidoglycan/LPS O-acetylase OafA/YrhL
LIGSEREENSTCSLDCAWTEDVKIPTSDALNTPIIGGDSKEIGNCSTRRSVTNDRSEIRALTGLRGVAAMLVVAYHLCPSTSASIVLYKDTIGRGYLWVDLFFILSGYVMALNYGKLFVERFSSAVFADFLLRRIARIYPLYIVMLCIQIAYTIAVYGNFRESNVWAAVTVAHPIRDIPANVFLAQSLGVSPSIIGQAWSISTEFAAYFSFPALVAWVLSGGRRGVAVAGLLAITLLVSVAAIDMHDGAYHSGPLDAYDGTHVTPLLRCLGGFILGMVTFRMSTFGILTTVVSRDRVGLSILLLLVVMLAAGVPDLAIVSLFPAVVLCVSKNCGIAESIFSNPIMYGAGVLSYSVYLLHPLLQKPLVMTNQILENYLPHVWATALSLFVAIAVLLILSGAAYNFIEKPGRRVIQHVAVRAPR